jgi:carboxymethylenebutenolidase
MPQKITLKAADGHEFDALRADPAGKPKGGIVVIQEIFGLTPHMHRLVDHFAADGYAAIAPALFDRVEKNVSLGYVGADYEKGHALRAALNEDWILADCAATVEALKPAGKVGLVGYCFGGLVAWYAGTKLDSLACSISLYGGGVQNLLDRTPKCPMQFHTGDSDRAIPLDVIQKVKDAFPDIPYFVYDDSPHGFCTDDREGAYRPEAAARAHARVLEFMGQHVA